MRISLPSRVMLVFLLSATMASTPVHGGSEIFLDAESLLPPLMDWSGNSEKLAASEDDPWITPSEMTGLKETPNYDETFTWLRKLVKAAPQLEMISIGKSHQGRDFWMIIASAEQNFTADALKASEKPLLLAQAGIHSGEIDGKDAGLMLLRDMTVAGKRVDLLEGVNLLFVPIFNVDGHERISDFNRINQRGPKQMGWRTNARNQNFNRDYAKLDTPGVQAIVSVINEYEPDLYLDLHVTDGVDYQYDITFGGNGAGGWSPAIGDWIQNTYEPAVASELGQQGHIPGPLVMSVNGMDLQDGYYVWNGDPRYSNGYGDARHLPTILVENHSLKPYRQRVLGTYVLLAASMNILAQSHEALGAAIRSDQQRRPEKVVLGYTASESEPSTSEFLGITSERYEGPVSGGSAVRWLGTPDNRKVKQVHINQSVGEITMPAAYMIPAQWADVAERVAMHGVPVQRLEHSVTTMAEVYRLPEAGIAPAQGWTPNPFEGRVRISAGTPEVETVQMTFPEGSFRVPTDHGLGELVALLLEPQATDSFFQWGFFLEVFTRTEYAETYIMEPLARRMIAEDPALKSEFESKLANDAEFAADPAKRLMWFYRKTPFYDPQYLVYPVVRIPR